MKTFLKTHRKTMIVASACLVSSVGLAGVGDITRINSPISVDANQQAGDLSNVNGEISVGDHSTVKDVRTVNGSIEVGSDSKTGSLGSVNGDLKIGATTHVSGNASNVNGQVEMDRASDLSGSLTNVNGSIHLTAAHVGDGITTVWGDIEIGKDSRVEHGILVKKPSGSFGSSSSNRPPTIVIAPGATVTGRLRFEHEVKLYVSDKAKIGTVEGAKVTVYSGDRP
jgi:DUF4097 and DUF4098 domain-containing protein YvlB